VLATEEHCTRRDERGKLLTSQARDRVYIPLRNCITTYQCITRSRSNSVYIIINNVVTTSLHVLWGRRCGVSSKMVFRKTSTEIMTRQLSVGGGGGN